MSIKRKLHHLVSGQLPEFVRVEYPQFVTFLEHYYRFLEQQGEAHDVLLNNADWTDIDVTLDTFIPYFRSQYSYDFPTDTLITNRKLIKYINQYYEAKGSENATEMFFRFMFNDTATVKYPGDYLLRASDGRWSRKRFIKVDTTRFPDENIFDLKEKVVTLYYLEFISGVGSFARTITTRCLDVYETSRPNIYQLQVDINPNYQFPDDITADTNLAVSLGNYDTHVYVQFVGEDSTTTYGTISKQLTTVVSIDDAGSKFRRDDSYFISETGVEGLYFAGDYTEVTTGSAAYAYEALQNNAIVRIVKTENTLAEQYFLEDYTLFGDYASAPTRGKIKLLSIVDSGEKFLVRKTGVIQSVTILDGGSGYATGATDVELIGDGTGAEFRVLVSEGKITQVTVVNGGSNYSNELDPDTGFPLTTLTASGSGTGAVLELVISTDFTPVKTFTVDFNNGRDGASPAEITFATGHIYHAPGEYVDNAGFLSDIIKLQDNDYYQPYSYVIETTEQLSNWKDTYLKSTHPAGFKMFSNLLLTGDITTPTVEVEDAFKKYNVEMFEETVSTAEVVAKSFNKGNVSENLVTSETFTKSIALRKTETVSTAETVTKQISQVSTEAVTLSENVAKNITRGTITDTVSISDSLSAVIVINRAFTDTFSISDVSTLAFNDAVTDTQSITDTVTFNFADAVTDTISTSDAISSINTAITLADSLTVSDTLNVNFNQANDATSDLQEDLSLADTAILAVNLGVAENVTTSDSLNSINTNLGPSDTISNTDALTLNNSIRLADSVSTSDTMVRNFNQNNDADSDLLEDVQLNDVPTLSTSYVFTDSQANTDAISINFSDVSTDTLSMSDAINSINTSLGITDTVSNTDTTAFNISDVLTDTITTSDNMNLLIVIPVNLADSVSVSDTVNELHPELNFSELLQADTQLVKNFAQNNDVDSDFSEDLSFSETTSFSLSDVLTDTFSVSDTKVLTYNDVVTDTQGVTDAGGTIFHESYFLESYTTTQNTSSAYVAAVSSF